MREVGHVRWLMTVVGKLRSGLKEGGTRGTVSQRGESLGKEGRLVPPKSRLAYCLLDLSLPKGREVRMDGAEGGGVLAAENEEMPTARCDGLGGRMTLKPYARSCPPNPYSC